LAATQPAAEAGSGLAVPSPTPNDRQFPMDIVDYEIISPPEKTSVSSGPLRPIFMERGLFSSPRPRGGTGAREFRKPQGAVFGVPVKKSATIRGGRGPVSRGFFCPPHASLGLSPDYRAWGGHPTPITPPVVSFFPVERASKFQRRAPPVLSSSPKDRRRNPGKILNVCRIGPKHHEKSAAPEQGGNPGPSRRRCIPQRICFPRSSAKPGAPPAREPSPTIWPCFNGIYSSCKSCAQKNGFPAENTPKIAK